MPNKAKQKGYRAEAEIVNLHKEYNIHSQRIPLSGAAGGEFKGDIKIGSKFVGEIKCRKNGSGFKVIEEWLGDNDFLFIKRDRQKPLVVMQFEQYAKLINQFLYF